MKRILIMMVMVCCLSNLSAQLKYPETPKIAVQDTLHGIVITDNYRWLEDSDDPDVFAWDDEQVTLTRSILDTIPQREKLIKRFNELWFYDDFGAPGTVVDGERMYRWEKGKDDEKWKMVTKENKDAEWEVLLDPNLWTANESIRRTSISRDGTYFTFGKTVGGNENPVVYIMDIATKEILPDTLRGEKQYVSSWLPDNSGFYYFARPAKGEVPDGEENYWNSVYLHKLGTSADEDEKIYFNEENMKMSHGVWLSECGNYTLYSRYLDRKQEVYFRRTDDTELIPIATGFDALYSVKILNDTILIKTNKDAPNGKVYITDVDHPQREYWREFIPEKEDKLDYIIDIAGHIFAKYKHNAYTVVKIYSLDGEFIRDLTLPTLGTASVNGNWTKDDIWVTFSSYMYPRVTYLYDFDKDTLQIYNTFPLDIDVEDYTAEQVWYNSKDGTPISMFLIHRKDVEKNGNNPVMLTGYGGFNHSQTPYFSTANIIWLEDEGMIAIPNLRGGGEYGEKWHEAGMKENKQNVFDDFIAAAEWLIDNKYTNPEKIAISGGSNGGLLVGAVTVQRPELFSVVNCSVPLLDMLRYHKFGPARYWISEYGSADNPEQFEYLYEYSPYHNIIEGTDYPAILFSASENDARVDPLHARKMTAALQKANPDGEPILYILKRDAGHGGGATTSMQIKRVADEWSFMMNKLGMSME